MKKLVNGFKKFWVNKTTDDDIYFSIVNPQLKNTSYMIRYFFTGKGGEYLYHLNLKHQKKIISSNEENATT